MSIEFLLTSFAKAKSQDAIIWQDRTFTYEWLLDRILFWRDFLKKNRVGPGSIVAIDGDFSPSSVAILLALIEHSCIVVPVAESNSSRKPEFYRIAEVEFEFKIDKMDLVNSGRTGVVSTHPIYQTLKASQSPGLVLFSSGSTGAPKGAVHNFIPMLDKYKLPRHLLRTLSFLLFDHIGGVNTLLYTLSNVGVAIFTSDRNPGSVLKMIETYEIELLPCSPTFLNLVLISGAHRSSNLSSLKKITYGTEPMPESLLRRCREEFPQVEFLQTYGLSELGILRSKSKSSDSLWVKVGGDGFETRVVDGLLQIKAKSAMLGYLNAPSPFTEDGWFMTGDAVEVEGDYLRILGRRSELINVGGEKVYPPEVESTIQEVLGVKDVAVFKEPNAISGNIVCAKVSVDPATDVKALKRDIILHCKSKLAAFKVPVKITFSNDDLHSTRLKKIRSL